MPLLNKTNVHIIKGLDKPTVYHKNMALFDRTDSLFLLDLCEDNSIGILGADGFEIERAQIRPRMDWILDFSSSWSSDVFDWHQTIEASRWAMSELPDGVLMEFVLRMPFNYPDAYLAGRTEFMQLDFHTDPRALIPRLETEVLVKEAGRLLQERVPDLIIDTGTGTGIIPITLAKRYGYANALIATDIDPDALGLAAENAILHDVGVELIQCDLLDSPELRQAISGVGSVLFVANLPYVPERDANLVSADTVYEPRHALYAGEDGYDCIAVYLEQFRGLIETHPNMSIALIMEMDPSHTDRTLSVLSDLGTAEPFADYAGDIRFVRFTRLWKN